jgi:tetratricopeptide (TPR) repeat protein
VARFYEGILAEAIPSGDGWWEQTAWETLRDRKDAAAFVEMGNAWSEEYSPAYQRNPREALRKAIAAYGEALRFYTPKVDQLDYARTRNKLGLAYWRLSKYSEHPKDAVENLRRAIAAYREALRFWTPDVDRQGLGYAWTQGNLGLAYWRLSEYEDRLGNLRRAIKAYEEVLRFYTPDVAPLDYAKTQNNLGLAYWRLSEYEDWLGNLRKAIEAYGKALRFYTPDGAPLNYAALQNNLGLAYQSLSEYGDPVGNSRKAIEAFKEALRFRKPDVAPLDYAETQNNLGLAYWRLSEYEDRLGNLREAIAAYGEALRFWTPERAPLLYAGAQHGMGLAYRRRADFQADPGQRCADLRAAIRAFREALRFRTPEATPPPGMKRPVKSWRRLKKPSAGPDAPGAPEAAGPATGARPELGALPLPAPRGRSGRWASS